MIAEASQVEKVLEDLISRLTKSASTPEIRAAIIDAKRLRTVTTRWSAIPPQPDARREMMARVMDLIARTGLSERDLRGTDPPPRRPIASGAPPPPPPRSSVPAPKPSAPPVLKREEAPLTPSFRQYEELGQTRPRPLREPVRPAREPQSLPISQKPTVPPAPRVLGVPQDMFGPPTIEPPAKPAAERSISPLPDRSISPLPQRAMSLQAQRSMSPARPIPQRSMSPAPAWRSNPSMAQVRGKSGQHDAVVDARREDSSSPPSVDSAKRALQTIQFNSGFLNNPEALRQSSSADLDSDPPPTRGKPTAPPQALLPPVTPHLRTSTAPPPLRAPHRAATIAGIPEANEAMIAAVLNRRTEPVDEPFDEVAKRSSLPTLSPPASPSSEPGPSSSPPERKRSKETLMMGALTAVEALKAVGKARAPALPADLEEAEFEPPPSTKPSSPPESVPAILGIGAPSRKSNHRIEGLSTKISETNLAPVSPSRSTQRPPPPTREPASQPQQHSPRTVVAPGISIVKPGTAAWQPHATQRGISQKVVYRDPRSGLYAALVKLAPGATLPRRRHAMTEEVFVVSGLATIDGHVFESGDYLRAEAETIHPSMTTKHGCTFFVIAGEHDEILDD